MKLRACALLATFVLLTAPLLSSPPSDNQQEMRDALKNLIVDNYIFYVTHKEDPCYFEWLQKQ